MKEHVVYLAAGHVVDRQLKIAPVRILACFTFLADRSNGTHDDPFVHEPRPGPVVVQLYDGARDILMRRFRGRDFG